MFCVQTFEPDLTKSLTPTLTEQTIHLWQLPLNLPEPSHQILAALLSVDEKIRAERLKVSTTRQQFINGRGWLRLILGQYCGFAPEVLPLTYSVNGKPGLVTSSLQFNLAHSGELALLAITNERPIGVDLEQIRPNRYGAQIIAKYFSKLEQAAFTVLPETEKEAGFLRFWTRKEAYLKADGKSLAQIKEFDTALLTGQSENWYIQNLTAVPGYFAAFAVKLGER